MCGFFGIYDFINRVQLNQSEKDYIKNELVKRGGDGFCSVENDRFYFAHSRLAIRGDSSSATQPIYSDSGRYLCLFNGEIYDSKEIVRDVLDKYGDTVALVKLIDAVGVVEALKSINGMFSIAVLDFLMNKIYMGIDFFGQKPLFYKINNGVLSFASTGKCLMYNKSLKDNLNRDSIISYLSYGFVGPDLCIFNNIEKVRPGQLVEVDLNSMNSKVFDNFQEQNYCLHEYSKYSEFHSTSQIHDLLTEVIRDHLASDFPVCSTLSSGVDSSIVTAYASKEMRKIRPENFRSYSITSSNEDDESAGAKKFADQLNVNLEYVNISEDKFKNYFNSIVANIDEPNSDSAIITSSAIFDVAKQTHKVILMGDGGDELFQGYKRHILHNVLSKLMGIWFFSKLVHPFLLITLKLVMLTGVRNQFLLILSNALKCANTPGNLIKSMLLIDDFGADLICSDDKNELKSPPHVDDQKFYLPGNNLYRVDRVSLLFGIESRAPLLDLRFLRISRSIDFSLSQNKNKKILKSIQKEIFSKIKIPKGKRGFNTSLKTFTDSKYAQNYIDIAINNLRDSYKIKFNQGMLSERRKYNLAVLGYWISNS